jgi:hypothetical protein
LSKHAKPKLPFAKKTLLKKTAHHLLTLAENKVGKTFIWRHGKNEPTRQSNGTNVT